MKVSSIRKRLKQVLERGRIKNGKYGKSEGYKRACIAWKGKIMGKVLE